MDYLLIKRGKYYSVINSSKLKEGDTIVCKSKIKPEKFHILAMQCGEWITGGFYSIPDTVLDEILILIKI